MSTSRKRAAAAVLAGLGLLAAACGSSKAKDAGTKGGIVDKGVQQGVNEQLGSTTTAAPAPSATSAAQATTVAPTTTVAAGPPKSMDDWNALWKTQREAIVKKIKDNKWGLSADGKTIAGPEGFSIDVSKCAAGWSNTEGLSDNEIKIGQTIAQSGTLAIYGQIAQGIQAHFDVINDAGGIKDSTGKARKITYIAKDDEYVADKTIPLVDELIDSTKVFVVWTLGSPNTMKTYQKLNDRCIPQPFAMTGHPAWGDPVNHPWTTGEQMAYNTEAVLWGAFIEQHADELKGADGKITVAGLVMNNDFGAAYNAGFKGWLAGSKLKDQVNYVEEKIEPSAPTITDAMTTLASKNPSVFLAETAGASCTQAITQAAQNGMKEKAKYLFQPSVCKGNGFVGKDKVGGDGSASDGWWVVGGGTKALEAPAYDSDPFAVYARNELKNAKAGSVDYTKQPTSLAGTRFAWDMEQALLIASALDGGLTRANFIVALRSMDMTAPFLLEGAKFNMNGNKDAYFTEASEFGKYNAAKQTFEQQGKLIELSGKSSNCAWDQAAATCKA